MKPSVLSLIIANLIPAAGVLFLNWDLASIIWLYWAENSIIGFFIVKKMIRSTGEKGPILSIPFFIMHYGMFILFHGLFLYWFFPFSGQETFSTMLAAPFLFLFVSHYVSYRKEYIGGKHYQYVDVPTLQATPYRRIVIMHIIIIFGAYAIQLYGETIGALVALVLVKGGIDLYSHLSEEKTYKEEHML